MTNDIRDMLEDLGMDEEFIIKFEASEMVKLAKWCKNLYEAGEAMYNDSMFMDRCTSEALNAWEEARKLETEDD